MASDFGASIRSCLLIVLAVDLLASNGEGFISAASQEENGHFETVPLSYILGEKDRGYSSSRAVSRQDEHQPVLEVVHSRNSQHLDRSEMLHRDNARVKWLQSKMVPVHQNDMKKSDIMASSAVSAGFNIGTAQYVVNVGLGNPAKKLQLEIDTGSEFTWTQCKPCSVSCYNQADPIFDPSASSSYSNIPCQSPTCSGLYRGNPLSCTSDGACRYYITYGDKSYSNGPLATDELTLTSTVSLPNYMFGCGQNNSGFVGVDGLLGLSNDGTFSMVTQGESRFGKYFSYCLPSTTETTGFLTLGSTTSSTGFSFTPITTVPQNPAFYGIKITGISIGGLSLSASSASILMNSNSIIDSGTIVTRLPSTVYSEVRSAFQQQMTQYPMVSGDGFLDTCYDFSKYNSITYPKIIVSFIGGVNLELGYSGIFFVDSPSQVCLAFATPNQGSNILIYGNVQQRTFEVAYDVANKELGFRANACS